MNEPIRTMQCWQCCYTNAIREVGGISTSGWQTVAVTEGLPSGAYTNCSKYQSANSTIRGQVLDEGDRVLNLLEFHGDGRYIYAVRTQYGLMDRVGRPNMFSHAYIFPWEDMLDPNVFLTLKKSNFARKEKEALDLRDREELEKREPFVLKQALQSLKLDQKHYIKLIQCVYVQCSDRRTSKPLYVGYDGTEEQMLALLYCIYCGLPFSIRKNLSVASAPSNSTNRHHIIFSRRAEKHNNYILPQSGKENVLNAWQTRRIQCNGYVDYALRKYDLGDQEAYNGFFRKLEETARSLGDPTGSNELMLKIAGQRITDDRSVKELEPEELESCLSDALRSRSQGNANMDAYIGELLEEIHRRGQNLTEESEAMLEDRLKGPSTEPLKQVGFAYNLYRFKQRDTDDAAKKLAKWRGTQEFEDYRQALNGEKDNKGQEILEAYYLNHLNHYLAAEKVTWEFLHTALEETKDLVRRTAVHEKIEEMGHDLYYGQADQDVLAVLGSYRKFLEAACPEECDNCINEAKTYYWDKWKKKEANPIGGFTMDKQTEYEAMAAPDHPIFQLYGDLAQVVQATDGGEGKCLPKIHAFACKYRKEYLPNESQEGVVGAKLYELTRAQMRMSKETAMTFKRWVGLAVLAQEEEQFQKMQDCRRTLENRDPMELRAALGAFTQDLDVRYSAPNVKVNVKQRLRFALLEEAKDMEQFQQPIALDCWMVLSEFAYNNAFEIFKHHTPAVVTMDRASVADASRLLRERSYQAHARYYLKQKDSKHTDAVRAWLDFITEQEAEAKRKAEELRKEEERKAEALRKEEERKAEERRKEEERKARELREEEARKARELQEEQKRKAEELRKEEERKAEERRKEKERKAKERREEERKAKKQARNDWFGWMRRKDPGEDQPAETVPETGWRPVELTKEQFALALRFVYLHLKQKPTETLYLICDEASDALKQDLLLVTPPYLRGALEGGALQVQRQKPRYGGYYVNLNDGTQNVSPQKAPQCPEYLDYAVGQYDLGDVAAYAEYFQWLEQNAQKLGDATGSNETILKIAHRMALREIPKEIGALEVHLRDALQSGAYGNPVMESYIRALWSTYSERGTEPAVENQRLLREWNTCSGHDVLASAAKETQEEPTQEPTSEDAFQKEPAQEPTPEDAFQEEPAQEPAPEETPDERLRYWEEKQEQPFLWFRLEDHEEYEKMAMDHPVSKLYADWYKAVSACEEDDDTCLKVINVFACSYDAWFPDVEATRLIASQMTRHVKTLRKDQEIPMDEKQEDTFWKWAEMALLLRETGLLWKLMGCREALEDRDASALRKNLAEVRIYVQKKYSDTHDQGLIWERLPTILLTSAKSTDTKEKPVKLDCWLTLGDLLYSNAFEIFDQCSPRIFWQDAAEVARASKLMQDGHYQNRARAYLEEKKNRVGGPTAYVKKWLNEVQNANQNKSKTGKPAGGYISTNQTQSGTSGENSPAKTRWDVSL